MKGKRVSELDDIPPTPTPYWQRPPSRLITFLQKGPRRVFRRLPVSLIQRRVNNGKHSDEAAARRDAERRSFNATVANCPDRGEAARGFVCLFRARRQDACRFSSPV